MKGLARRRGVKKVAAEVVDGKRGRKRRRASTISAGGRLGMYVGFLFCLLLLSIFSDFLAIRRSKRYAGRYCCSTSSNVVQRFFAVFVVIFVLRRPRSKRCTS